MYQYTNKLKVYFALEKNQETVYLLIKSVNMETFKEIIILQQYLNHFKRLFLENSLIEIKLSKNI